MIFGLERMRAVMAAYAHPQNAYPVFHIAGTNGKGSVCAMVSTALTHAGYKTGLYTSPHLARVHERFQIDGRVISDAELSTLTDSVRRRLKRLSISLTQFEFLTVLAFLWFQRKRVDVAVIETGLGGRLDATNVVENVVACAITSIGFDHMNYLGTTLPAIAREKAGIIKLRTPVVASLPPHLIDVIRPLARARQAPLIKTDFPVGPFHLRLEGRHQQQNAATAWHLLTQARIAGFSLTPRQQQHGIEKARWPGRFERFWLKNKKGRRRDIILDGAHNAPAARVLVDTLKRAARPPYSFLFGALRDKDINGILRLCAPLAATARVVTVSSDRAEPADQLAAHPLWKGKAKAVPQVKKALDELIHNEPNRFIVVTGSIYLVGAVRQHLTSSKGVHHDIASGH